MRPLWSHLTFTSSLKAPSPENTVILWVRASTYEFGGADSDHNTAENIYIQFEE
jgi:hypothetical protein